MMKLIYICLLISMLALGSCTRNFESINLDPNHPTKVEPDFLFTSSIVNTMNLYGGEMNRVVFFNYTQQYSGFQGEFERYTYSPSSDDKYWSETYIECLQPVHQIVVNYQNDSAYRNRVLIARVWEDYLYSNTVSIWGGIPMKGALGGNPSIPYTKEQDVYTALLTDLKGLADSISPDGDKYGAQADLIYGGDLLKWKKFANTLRLRLAMRISNDEPYGNPEMAEKVVREIYEEQENTLTDDDETAAAHWGTTSDSWSYMYDYVIYSYTAHVSTIPVLCESLVYYTVPYGDPRIAVYGQPATRGPRLGAYFGQNISYGGGGPYAPGIENPHTGLKQDDYSYIGERFLKPDAEYVFLSDAESCLLKAEAVLKGWWGNGNAEDYYYQGIEASFAHYGLTPAESKTYEETPGIKWGTASDTTGKEAEFWDWMHICTSYVSQGDYERQIIMQHWLAIPMQGVDAWALLRRTRILDFEPQFATYDGKYAYLPERIPYPPGEYSTNPSEVQKGVQNLGGTDDLFTKLWFAKPHKKNPYLPY